MDKRWFRGISLFGLLFITANSALSADIIMTAPPRESASEGKALYQPLARYISKLIDARVVYKSPRSWADYQRNMRNDKYDIIFDDPHFIAWRIAHLRNDVLIKLPGKLEYFLVTNKTDKTVGSAQSLVGQKICTIASPDLSSLTVLTRFRNPVRQPIIYAVNAGMDKVYAAFIQGKCKAASIDRKFYTTGLTEKQRDDLRILFRSKPLPNLGISVSQRINARAKNRILTAFTVGKGVKFTKELIDRFGNNKTRSFLPAKNREYMGHNMLLEEIIFSWQKFPNR